jgi:hypothetical protein
MALNLQIRRIIASQLQRLLELAWRSSIYGSVEALGCLSLAIRKPAALAARREKGAH